MFRREVEFAEVIEALYRQTSSHAGGHGVLLTSVGSDGVPNVMTIGWGLYGWFSDAIAEQVRFCGVKSGRDCDKFKETGLTPVPSARVRAPSIAQCPIHVECRIYYKQRPPHFILTPEHRERPLAEQHTIYFAEVLGAYRAEEAGPG